MTDKKNSFYNGFENSVNDAAILEEELPGAHNNDVEKPSSFFAIDTRQLILDSINGKDEDASIKRAGSETKLRIKIAEQEMAKDKLAEVSNSNEAVKTINIYTIFSQIIKFLRYKDSPARSLGELNNFSLTKTEIVYFNTAINSLLRKVEKLKNSNSKQLNFNINDSESALRAFEDFVNYIFSVKEDQIYTLEKVEPVLRYFDIHFKRLDNHKALDVETLKIFPHITINTNMFRRLIYMTPEERFAKLLFTQKIDENEALLLINNLFPKAEIKSSYSLHDLIKTDMLQLHSDHAEYEAHLFHELAYYQDNFPKTFKSKRFSTAEFVRLLLLPQNERIKWLSLKESV